MSAHQQLEDADERQIIICFRCAGATNSLLQQQLVLPSPSAMNVSSIPHHLTLRHFETP
jgi:hypothetical protein